jgi:multiple sugar transport system permease protein
MRRASILLVTIVALILIAPTVLLVLGSLRTDTDMIAIPPHVFPRAFTLSQYQVLFIYPMGRWLLNSVIVTASSTLLMLAVTTSAGYAFAKKRFAMKEKVFWTFLASMMIPATVLFSVLSTLTPA